MGWFAYMQHALMLNYTVRPIYTTGFYCSLINSYRQTSYANMPILITMISGSAFRIRSLSLYRLKSAQSSCRSVITPMGLVGMMTFHDDYCARNPHPLSSHRLYRDIYSTAVGITDGCVIWPVRGKARTHTRKIPLAFCQAICI